MASLIAEKFSVVTTLARSIAPIERNLVKYGLAARCARVRASNVPVLALEEPGSDARRTSKPRSSGRSPKTARKRSCSAAPA